MDEAANGRILVGCPHLRRNDRSRGAEAADLDSWRSQSMQENQPLPGNGAPQVPADGAYGAAQIQVLEGLEAVRRRPGMYIGSTDERGLHHLFYEVIDNSIDEAMNGFASRIETVIHADGSLSVQDDGRGIPVEIHPKTGKPALET